MSRLADEVRKTFASMHISRNFRLFFAGQLISVTGTWINWTAGAVLVLQLTNSGVALGIETALMFLPVLVLGVWAGSLADRFDKRRILVWANAGYGLLAAVQFTLVATGIVQIWMVFVIAFLYGLILAIEPPTHHERGEPQQRRVHRHARPGRRRGGLDDRGVRALVPLPAGHGLVPRGDPGAGGDAPARAPAAAEGHA